MRLVCDNWTIAKQRRCSKRLNHFPKSIWLFALLCFVNAIKAEMDIIRQDLTKTNIFTA